MVNDSSIMNFDIHITLKVACSAGVFFGRANVLIFLLSLIFLRHNKDGGYNSTNINKQLSPAQNTPALQATLKVQYIIFRNASLRINR